jgi:hypothetical protein
MLVLRHRFPFAMSKPNLWRLHGWVCQENTHQRFNVFPFDPWPCQMDWFKVFILLIRIAWVAHGRSVILLTRNGRSFHGVFVGVECAVGQPVSLLDAGLSRPCIFASARSRSDRWCAIKPRGEGFGGGVRRQGGAQGGKRGEEYLERTDTAAI